MKVLAIEKEMTKELGIQARMAEEAQRVYELYKADKIREIYFQKQNHTAVIIFEVKDIIEARNLINSLPLVINKLIDFDLMELIPYNGLDRIIEKL
jgi:muconolactone delta-isomerase